MKVHVVFSAVRPPVPVAMMPGIVSAHQAAMPKREFASARAARSGKQPKPDAAARFRAGIRRRYEPWIEAE